MQNNPNQKSNGTFSDYESKRYEDKVFVFELLKRNPENGIMKAADTGKVVPYPISFPIPLVGSVLMMNKDRGVVAPRRIRVAAGEPSIFVDERISDTKNKEVLVNKNFIRGKCHIDGTDSVVLEFMLTSDMCENKPNRDPKKRPKYRLVDTSIIANKAMEADKLEFDVISWCHNGDWDTEVKPLARIILKGNGIHQKPEDIRYDLTLIAKASIPDFKKMLDDPKTKRKMVVYSAIDKGIVEVDTSENVFYWKDHRSNPITQAAPGLDVVDDFILKSFSGNGEVVYNTIYAQVHPEDAAETIPLAPEIKKEEPKEPVGAPSLTGPTETTDELSSLVQKGLDEGFITGNPNSWIKYGENKSVMKIDGMVKFLRDNEIILKLLKRDLLVE